MADRLLLVVEGPDDKHVFWAILARHQFEPQFSIRDEGGFETLLARLPIHLKPGTDLERLGIVLARMPTSSLVGKRSRTL
jgi:hypothetical protein